MKTEIPLNKAKWLVELGCVIIVTSGDMERANLMTFSWQTPVNSSNPCLVLLVMHHARYSYELIKRNQELVINVPGEDLVEETHLVGTVSGRNINTFQKSGLTPESAKMVQPPLIKECAGHLECQVVDIFAMKAHDLLICEVIRAVADSDVFNGKWITPMKLTFANHHTLTSHFNSSRRARARMPSPVCHVHAVLEHNTMTVSRATIFSYTG